MLVNRPIDEQRINQINITKEEAQRLFFVCHSEMFPLSGPNIKAF